MAKTIPSSTVLTLTLARGRKDKGETKNYRVYEGGGTMAVASGSGETVIKNAIMGANGTVYVGNTLAQGIDSWVLIPEPLYRIMHAAYQTLEQSASKKGKK